MKKLFWNLFLIMLLAVIPLSAQDFQSTSTMRPSGSSYSSSVTPVGSETPAYVGSSVGSLPSSVSERRGAAMEEDDFDSPFDPNRSDESPVGEAWVLLAFAAAGAGVVYLRRRKAGKEA